MTVEAAWRHPSRSSFPVAVWLRASLFVLALGTAECQSGSIFSVVSSNSNLTFLASAINAAGLNSYFSDNTRNLTLFAPSDNAFRSVLSYGALTCTTDYYSTATCSTPTQLLAASDLKVILSNLVVSGNFPSSAFANGTRLQLTGSAVQQVYVMQNKQPWLGNSPVTTPDVQASNGIVHILGTWPTTDLSLNETSITAASKLGDFGPFNLTTRLQLITPGSNSLPTSITSLVDGYRRIRIAVDLPQGGLVNPMSISYDPTAMYRLLRAAPDGGYLDSEAVNAKETTGGISGNAVVGSPISISSTPTAKSGGPALAVSSVELGPTGSSKVSASSVEPGIAEANVLSPPCSDSNASWQYQIPDYVDRPADNDTLAYMTVMELASLIRSRQVTSVELVEIYTARLKRYDYVLEAVVTYTTDLGMKQAAVADELLERGIYLGPLHGIPYGLKDIIAVSGYPTTWGAPQFRNQFINEDAHVYQQLQQAGAVLIAKLATGEMAYDDVWWGGKTKNPWNIAEGSSGSSAGPAASVVAATVPFSVGSETEGSLMSPAATCGATAMRPSLGSIGRSWVMTLADSLDKLGPICRSVTDCAVIFDILRGQDDMDPTSRTAALLDPFEVDLAQMTVGYVPGMDETAPEVMDMLRSRGVTLKPFTLGYTVNAEDVIMTIMITEAAAHFDYWQRSGQDNLNRRQDYWPPLLRLARLIPAVEYIQAQRARSNLAVQVLGAMRAAGIDAFISNTTTELAMCNLVGIPTVSVPIGYASVSGIAGANTTRREPVTIGFFGWPNGEPEILALGMAWQNETSYHLKQPPIDNVERSVLAACQPYSRCSLPPGTLSPASAPSINITTGTFPSGLVTDSG